MNYQSSIYSKYLSNEKMRAIVSDEALIEKMVIFEKAVVRAQQKIGIVPAAMADQVANALEKATIKPNDLADGTLQNGIPLISFLSIIKSQLSSDASQYLHYGLTSQDVMDSALVLILSDAMVLIEKELEELKDSLQKLNKNYGNTRCMARTRGQLAAPVTFGLKISSWLQPLDRQSQRLKEISGRLLKVQLGGAVGDLTFFKDNGEKLVHEVASALKLSTAPSWHSQRDTLAEFTNWLAMLTGITGKMGSDILVMSQNEIGEIIELADGGGKSSAMPHKSNPVLSEALVAMSRINATLQSQQLLSVVHSGERDASAWILEWNAIPQMLMMTATSLSHAITIASEMKVNTEVMEKNVASFTSKNGK